MPAGEVASQSARALSSVCLGCAALFEARRPDHVYCSARCRARASRDRRVARLLAHLPVVAHFLPPAVEDEVLGPLAAEISRGRSG